MRGCGVPGGGHSGTPRILRADGSGPAAGESRAGAGCAATGFSGVSSCTAKWICFEEVLDRPVFEDVVINTEIN